MPDPIPNLTELLHGLDPQTAADRLSEFVDADIAHTLSELGPRRAMEILEKFSSERGMRIAAAASNEGQLWLEDRHYPEGSIGRLMERTPAVFAPAMTVRAVVEALRDQVRQHLISYIYVTDAEHRLIGVVVFREMLFAHPEQTLADIMIERPFSLRPETELVDAMREVVTRHYPVYPVCDGKQKLLGIVRGEWLFEQQAFEISAQAGSMVGVEKEERTTTPWPRSLKFRHPWLQLNLFTAFVAAAVVGLFQDTVNRIVLLAVFLPVLSGQCSNTGCQALAVTLRGMTLNELRAGRSRELLIKEAWLGLLNGLLVGLVAGMGMYLIATIQHTAHALRLALITLAAMALSCLLSGIAGAAVPLALKRLGADPATASSIFLTTATDVVSMGLFLGLAYWLVP